MASIENERNKSNPSDVKGGKGIKASKAIKGSKGSKGESSSLLTRIMGDEDVHGELKIQKFESESLLAKEDANLCVECEDQPHRIFCKDCVDYYCRPCFQYIHKKGTRKSHVYEENISSENNLANSDSNLAKDDQNLANTNAPKLATDCIERKIDDPSKNQEISSCLFKNLNSETFVERSKFIPMRLKLFERKYLRLVEAMMSVSEYTDRVDILSHIPKRKRIVAQIKEICAILTGLVTSVDYKEGRKLLDNPEFSQNEIFFQAMFEFARRHKIRNPEMMRESYGKLTHFLQDSVSPDIKNITGLNCVSNVKTVHRFLKDRGALDCLKDCKTLLKATDAIPTQGKTRREINYEIREKERHFKYFVEKNSEKYRIPREELELAIYSISDNHSFLESCRLPVDKMIRFLKDNFDPNEIKSDLQSLAISGGFFGSRLSHNHKKQYSFVLQTLTLWRTILNDFFRLWHLAEKDLLDPDSSYRLIDTGQGLNRVQSCPRVQRAMRKILHSVQNEIENWVGSSVIHLGDHNVPNSLSFIDKYTQVPRILAPLVITIEKIPEIMSSTSLAKFVVSEFGTAENLKLEILSDFFKYGFDGSGADNFYDAGSCIDGRLTSAWNWCSKIARKRFYPVFLFTGFSSFDGDFS